MLLFAPFVLAFDSETQAIDLADTAEIFTNIEYSTGVVPAGSPLGVEFSIEANGGADISMEGEADLSWPEALLLQFTGEPGSGIFLLDASLDAVTTIAIDLSDWGYYGSFEIDRRTLTFDGASFFDPFVLDGSATPRVEIVDPGNNTNLITYTYSIIAGLDLTFNADMSTEVTVGFSGEQFLANDAVITTENAIGAVTYEPVADYVVDTVYTGGWDADISLILSPSIEACASIFGCFTVVEFDVPISLLTDSFSQDFPAITPTFPLPLIDMALTQADMGSVEVGQLANLDVPVGNAGSLDVYGDARIEGSADFSVYPATFNVNPGTEDGMVVTFGPTAEGAQTAELILTSNDPGEPELRIPLTANGTVTPEPEDDQGYDVDDDAEIKSVSSCGCDAGAGSLGLVGVFAAGLMARRRRA